MSLAEKERLTVEARLRLQADIEPHTRVFLERALEAIPEMTDLALETLAAELAKPPDRLERELRNLHRNIHRETSGTG